jgi:peptidoglycan/LPS O-acetylase OafA/YrhL
MKPRPRIAGIAALVASALAVALVVMYAVDGRWWYSLFWLVLGAAWAVVGGANLRVAARGDLPVKSQPRVAGAFALVLSVALVVVAVWQLVDGQWFGLTWLFFAVAFALIGWSHLRAARGESATPA